MKKDSRGAKPSGKFSQCQGLISSYPGWLGQPFHEYTSVAECPGFNPRQRLRIFTGFLLQISAAEPID
jgi:hypothetical protein